MMEKNFNVITLYIEEDKIKSIINDALSESDSLFKEIRKNIPVKVKVPGFSSVRKVPFQAYGKLTQAIFVYNGFCEPTMASLILKGWYYKHGDLIEIVRKALENCGYLIKEPDFDSQKLDVNSLNSEDINKSEEGSSFFYPKGDPIQGIDKKDATIAAALLGWFVFNQEELSNMGTNEGCEEKVEIPENAEEQKLAEKLPNEPGVFMLDEYKNDSETKEEKSIDSLLNKLEEKFKSEGEYFSNVSQMLFNGVIPPLNEINERILSLSIHLKAISDKIGDFNIEKFPTLEELKNLYSKSQESLRLAESRNTIFNEIHKILSIRVKKGSDPKFIKELYNTANDFEKDLLEAEFPNMEWVQEMINKEHYFNLIIKAIEVSNQDELDFEHLDNLLVKIKVEFLKYKLGFYEDLATQLNRRNLVFSKEFFPEPTDDKEDKKQKLEPSKKKVEKQKEVDSKGEKEVVNDFADQNKEKSNPPQPKLEVAKHNISVEIEPEAKPEGGLETEVEKIPKNGKQEITDASEPLVTPEKKDQTRELSEEDNNILNLLEIGETELAYHLSKCYESQNIELFFPSWLLQNLSLSLEIRTATGPIAQKISANLNNFITGVEKSERGHFKNQLLFASMLRPSLVAYNAVMGSLILPEIHNGKLSEFSELKRLIGDYMSHTGGLLTYDRILHITGQEELSENKEKFFEKVKGWLDRAQNARFRNNVKNYHTQVFNSWVKYDGRLNNVLSEFLKDPLKHVLRSLLDEVLEKSAVEKRFLKDLKAISGNKKSPIDNTEATRWFHSQIESLREILEEGFSLMEQEDDNNHNDEEKLLELFRNFRLEFDRVKGLLQGVKEENRFNQISFSYLVNAFDNIEKILTGGKEVQGRISLEKIMNGPLLRLAFYESEYDWTPKEYNSKLKASILEVLKTPERNVDEIAKDHLVSGNFEALERLSSIGTFDISKLNITRNIEEFSELFKEELKKAKAEVERGCAYGYILNGKRTQLISAIEIIKENFEDQIRFESVFNYPLLKNQLNEILNLIETEKETLIKRNKEQIPKTIKKDHLEILLSFLEKCNLLAFNETLQRINDNQYVLDEERTGLFREFFNDYLSKEPGRDASAIRNALRGRNEYNGISFKGISRHQSDLGEEILQNWYFIKNSTLKNNNEGFGLIKPIIDFLGFNNTILDNVDKFSKSVYFDVSCNPIKGRSRSPLPHFGSVANGKYRFVCLRQQITEEDLVEEIRELLPDTDRAVIVFNFSWLNQQSRLEISKLCKIRRITFLLLDEAMLIYLLGVKESKLPTFIKLAAPFTFAEPYQTASSNLPEEMFYGRKPQIQKLKNIIGDFSCLIYGGRQLGKTVLQREVERIFHNPEKNHFAIYIDLRDSGIGLWNPIEGISSVLLDNLKVIPGLIPDKYQESAGLNFVVTRTRDWLNKNKDGRIILFLDESDRFLEQDAQKDWPHILPLKGLMEKTDKRFKIILAGLHDVRRTIKIPNNPLAHFGNPICVGPMIEKEEAFEAQMLIKTPLETLGYEFESDDLVFLILSHCNWYPSLIQIFCSRLLNQLNEKRHFSKLPVLITANDITSAYERSREQIKEKFNLTLGLDERYDLLANIIASETIENSTILADGFPAKEIAKQAIEYWPEGFDFANPSFEVTNLLEEMVDLGILRSQPLGNFALRTPNLQGLIGEREQIWENLINKDRSLPKEFKRENSRIIYSIKGRELRSPFPAIYYDRIVDPENKAIVFRGSKMSGIEHIEGFLKIRNIELNLIIPEFLTLKEVEVEEFWKGIDKKRISKKQNIILFNVSNSYTTNDILQIKDMLSTRKSLSALFLVDPGNMWKIFSDNHQSFAKLENQNIPIFNLSNWKEDVAKDWFRETGCITADVSEIFTLIGGWHGLIDRYHEKIIQKPEAWKEKLVEFEKDLLADKLTVLTEFGLINDELINEIKYLDDWDGSISGEEYLNEIPDLQVRKKRENFIDFFSSLNLIDNELKVNKLVKKLLRHE